MIAASLAMQEIGRKVERLAQSNVPVLVQGETGTGKQMVARAIHEAGPRAPRPFVVIHADTLPAALGAFQAAQGGSIFLDDVGELPPAAQPALLGALERRSADLDVRVISATKRDLGSEASRGAFLADLYFKLAAARIEIPPLRERPEDIAPLVAHFAAELTGAPGWLLSEPTMAALRAHPWSGNVRELRDVVERALATGSITLTGSAQPGAAAGATIVPPYRVARADALAAFERAYLRRLIASTGGNASAAARTANMDRPYLLSLLRRHGLR
jgi:DNA-binding NtrC family response regulator